MEQHTYRLGHYIPVVYIENFTPPCPAVDPQENTLDTFSSRHLANALSHRRNVDGGASRARPPSSSSAPCTHESSKPGATDHPPFHPWFSLAQHDRNYFDFMTPLGVAMHSGQRSLCTQTYCPTFRMRCTLRNS